MIYLYSHRTSYGVVHRFYDIKTVEFYSACVNNNNSKDYFILYCNNDGFLKVHRTEKFYYNIDKINYYKVESRFIYTEKLIIEKLIQEI